jgi:hypothetical protein
MSYLSLEAIVRKFGLRWRRKTAELNEILSEYEPAWGIPGGERDFLDRTGSVRKCDFRLYGRVR